MLIERYPIIPMMVSQARKIVPASAGTFPAHGGSNLGPNSWIERIKSGAGRLKEENRFAGVPTIW